MILCPTCEKLHTAVYMHTSEKAGKKTRWKKNENKRMEENKYVASWSIFVGCLFRVNFYRSGRKYKERLVFMSMWERPLYFRPE